MKVYGHTLRRPGATALETAIVLSVLFVMIIAIIVGGMTVLRYQQVACLAREGARWASVRGGDDQRETGTDGVMVKQIVSDGILPYAAAMDPGAVSVEVFWVDQSTGIATDWDLARRDVRSITAGGEYVTNTVRVIVTYTWASGFLSGPTVTTSRCEFPMTH